MCKRSVEELRRELDRLLQAEIESLRKRTFGGLGEEELQQEEQLLKRIREVSADYLAALERQTTNGEIVRKHEQGDSDGG